MPKGNFWRVVFCTFRKLTKMPWAVSGRRYTLLVAPAVEPNSVENIKLNCLTSVQFFVPLMGSTISSSRIICFSASRSGPCMAAV